VVKPDTLVRWHRKGLPAILEVEVTGRDDPPNARASTSGQFVLRAFDRHDSSRVFGFHDPARRGAPEEDSTFVVPSLPSRPSSHEFGSRDTGVYGTASASQSKSAQTAARLYRSIQGRARRLAPRIHAREDGCVRFWAPQACSTSTLGTEHSAALLPN